jgi:chaperonin cofactor prefoldin
MAETTQKRLAYLEKKFLIQECQISKLTKSLKKVEAKLKETDEYNKEVDKHNADTDRYNRNRRYNS